MKTCQPAPNSYTDPEETSSCPLLRTRLTRIILFIKNGSRISRMKCWTESNPPRSEDYRPELTVCLAVSVPSGASLSLQMTKLEGLHHVPGQYLLLPGHNDGHQHNPNNSLHECPWPDWSGPSKATTNRNFSKILQSRYS